jgi:hypothetical protein
MRRRGAKSIRTFRAHSWIVWVAAAAITVKLLLRVLDTSGAHAQEGTAALIFLHGLTLLLPVALIVWDRQRGVHVRADGIKCVSANGSRFLAWRDIKAFEIDAYAAGTLAVFAQRQDGTSVALGDTSRWPYQRRSVEQIKRELESYRERSAEHGGILASAGQA